MRFLVHFHLQIINDRNVGGKCYGFISFTNPQSASHAIKDMDGRVLVSFTLLGSTDIHDPSDIKLYHLVDIFSIFFFKLFYM